MLMVTGMQFASAPIALLSVLLTFTAIAPMFLCVVSQCLLQRNVWDRARYLPILLALGIGTAVTNSRAVMEAILGIETGFVRTPKKGTRTGRRYGTRLSKVALVELLMGAYCFITLCLFVEAHKFLATPYLLINALGFTSVGALSVWHFLQERRPANA
jgi:hypothetical protein